MARQFFAERGFAVSFTIDNSQVHWAGLVKAGGEVVFLRYGSGASMESAATYAHERWSKGEEDRPTVGGQLRALGVKRGMLLVLADEGLLELRCTVKPCYCPYGDDYFDFKLHPPGPWPEVPAERDRVYIGAVA